MDFNLFINYREWLVIDLLRMVLIENLNRWKRLHFFPFALENVHGMIPPKEFCDFEKEPGKLWFRSPMIMNGVCCVCVGYVNLTKLDGTARLEFDNEYARVSEDSAERRKKAFNES